MHFSGSSNFSCLILQPTIFKPFVIVQCSNPPSLIRSFSRAHVRSPSYNWCAYYPFKLMQRPYLLRLGLRCQFGWSTKSAQEKPELTRLTVWFYRAEARVKPYFGVLTWAWASLCDLIFERQPKPTCVASSHTAGSCHRPFSAHEHIYTKKKKKKRNKNNNNKTLAAIYSCRIVANFCRQPCGCHLTKKIKIKKSRVSLAR